MITHDRLSEIGPGQAESRDQPLLCSSPPIPSMHTTIKRDRKYKELPLSFLTISPSVFLVLKMPKHLFISDSLTLTLWQRE